MFRIVEEPMTWMKSSPSKRNAESDAPKRSGVSVAPNGVPSCPFPLPSAALPSNGK